jgi:hypothetical protein
MSTRPPPRAGAWQYGRMSNSTASIIKRAKSAALAPLRHQAQYVNQGLEDLIHTIKNELMSRFDAVDSGVEQLSTATTDRLGLMSSRISSLEAEIQALRAEVAALKKNS